MEYFVLENFLTFCEKYIVGENGMLVDMKFLPRIKEGEIRIMMVGDKPIFVVHKNRQIQKMLFLPHYSQVPNTSMTAPKNGQP